MASRRSNRRQTSPSQLSHSLRSRTLGQISKPSIPQDGTITAIVLRHKAPRRQINALRDFIACYGHYGPHEIEPAHIHAVINGWRARLSNATVSTYVHILKTWLVRLQPYGLHQACIDTIPPQEWRTPRNVTITAEELDKALAAANPSLHLWILLCHDCALRSMNAISLSRHHYDEGNGTLTLLAKGQEPICIPTTARVRAILRDLKHPHRPFVQQLRHRSTTFNMAYLRQMVTREWSALKIETGIRREIRLHDLRRTMARKVYDLTGDVRVAQGLLGHKSPLTTWRYLDSMTKGTSAAAVQEFAAHWKGSKADEKVTAANDPRLLTATA